MNNFEDMQKMGQQNLDTAMKGFGEWGRTWQAMAAEASNYAKRSVEEGTATMEKLANAKSFDQVVAIQSDFARRSYEEYVAQCTKISSMYVDMARDAYRPFDAVSGQVRQETRQAAESFTSSAKKRSR